MPGMGPRRSRRVATRSARRKLVWAQINVSLGPLLAGQLGSLDLLAPIVAGASALGATVMRTHVRLQFTYATAADFYAYGLIVDRAALIGVNVAGTADPQGTPEDDWRWNDVAWAIATGAAVDVQREIMIDSRSKARVQELQQTYMIVVRNSTAATQTPRVFARTLIALP